MAENCCIWVEVATAFLSRRGRDAIGEEDCAGAEEDWAALGNKGEMGGNVGEEVVVVAETRDVIEDVGRVRVDDVEDTGVLR